MGAGEHILSFHLHHHHHHDVNVMKNVMKKDDEHKMNIPKGYVAVMVGHEGEEQKRFIIPVMYLNHPLFMELLKEAEDEYGFQHQGLINIPRHIQDFCNVQRLIDHDYNHHHHYHHHHHHHHHICCFKD
ncbi:hypothetical protein L6452_04492 [Arctium lappa]|uniref:Uncharacterized protein n=1 Tax=Arctium lappa TaxID=4217 RepID=A0ACB9EDN0_ARCLA|nr:hypothetical protein L6452_04492 [Arctium lappa]